MTTLSVRHPSYLRIHPYFSKSSSLGKEKTVVHSSPGKFERQSPTQYLYTIPYFLLLFPSFRFLNLFIHTQITPHQTNSYMKNHKHQNIKRFDKHAQGVPLLAF